MLEMVTMTIPPKCALKSTEFPSSPLPEFKKIKPNKRFRKIVTPNLPKRAPLSLTMFLISRWKSIDSCICTPAVIGKLLFEEEEKKKD
jgi:hypothetical protein